MVVDHINGDTLDNRLENLRLATTAQNAQNKTRSGRSRHVGVYYNQAKGKWQAQIQMNGHKRNLGRFDSEEEAAQAALAARLKAFTHFVPSRHGRESAETPEVLYTQERERTPILSS
jgi:muconolactone delta-isomerase